SSLFLQHMVMSFRVSELQVLLGFAGRNKSGRKHELLAKALQLLKPGCSPAILTPSDLSMLHVQAGQLPSAAALTPGAVCHLPYDHGSPAVPAALLPPAPLLGPKHETDVPRLPPPVHPVHPDVKMKRLPFYDVYDELIKPTTLG
ncbi:E3 SUMO-protein ligase PIAS1, partial [Aptenodytes patagonicus]